MLTKSEVKGKTGCDEAEEGDGGKLHSVAGEGGSPKANLSKRPTEVSRTALERRQDHFHHTSTWLPWHWSLEGSYRRNGTG